MPPARKWLSHAAALCLASVIGVLSATGLLLVAPATAATGQPAPLISPTPGWVDRAAIPAPSSRRLSEVRDGLYYLLVDHQIRRIPSGKEHYIRIAYKIVERSGLESGASVGFRFNPSDERLELHSLKVRRGDQVESRLSGTEVVVIRRETEIGDGILNGRLYAHLNLVDVRVGDIVEYEASWVSETSLWPQHFFHRARTSWSAPIGLARLRLIWPEGTQLNIRVDPDVPAPDVTRQPEGTLYQWVWVDPEPVLSEDHVPAWRDKRWGLSLSTAESWAEVADLMTEFYPLDAALPNEFARQVDEIGAQYIDPGDRATEALRLVQDAVRYVGIEIGTGAYVPRLPTEVLRRGYGDCKDKALLLAVVLRRLGIEAVPALTHLEKGRGLADELPSVQAFDHVIVEARIRGKRYWLDPTGSHQGGRLPDLASPGYGTALPIGEGDTDLVPISDDAASTPTMSVIEVVGLPVDDGDPLSLLVRSIFRGRDADRQRFSLASGSKSEFERGYLEYYNGLYPGIEMVVPIAINDDTEKNEIEITETYRLSQEDWRRYGTDTEFPLYAETLNGVLPVPRTVSRSHPVAPVYPAHRRHSIVIMGSKTRLYGVDKEEIDTEAYAFSLTSESRPDGLRIDWTLRSKTPEVSPKMYATYLTDARSIQDSLDLWIDLSEETSADSFDEIADRVLVGIMAILFVAGVFAVHYGLRADAAYAAKGVFFPVRPGKFAVMSVATCSLYPLLWQWKFWRWRKNYEGVSILPFWRGVIFGHLWLYMAFREANSRLGERRVPQFWGVGAAIMLLVSLVVAGVLERRDPEAVYWLLIYPATFVWFLPAVLAVNRLNRDDPVALNANSRLNLWNVAGIVVGLMFYALLIFAAFLP